MSGPSDKDRLDRLDARIRRAKGETEARDAPRTTASHDQAHLAWRMVIELVTGIVIGFGIGYGLDAAFGTRPWMMVVFVLLGFAAGIRVMLRTARELNRPGKAPGDDEGT